MGFRVMSTVLMVFTIVIASLACDNGDDFVPELETRSITVENGDRSEQLTVELAVTPGERSKGLMYRQSLPENRGMLFLFPGESRGGFYMKNTYVPLDIAYIGADGRVQEIVQGKPLDETVLTPQEPYQMVLEVNQGWFERHGMGVGSLVRVPNDLPEGR